jgi:hypothetical protein
MLTAEIKVNGCLIGHLYMVNTGPIANLEPSDLSGPCAYRWEYYHCDGYPPIQQGEGIIHDRDAGALGLIKKVIETIEGSKKHTRKGKKDKKIPRK